MAKKARVSKNIEARASASKSKVSDKRSNPPKYAIRDERGRFISRAKFDARARARYGPSGRAWTPAEKRAVAAKVARAATNAQRSGKPHIVVRQAAPARRKRVAQAAPFSAKELRELIVTRLRELVEFDTDFVTVRLGTARGRVLEFRARPTVGRITRGIAGLVVGLAVSTGGTISATARMQISEIVNKGASVAIKEYAPRGGIELPGARNIDLRTVQITPEFNDE